MECSSAIRARRRARVRLGELAEHHYAPFSLTPNPMVMAGAVTQRVRRAKIALLGANIPILNPVRVAEEFAMLDVLTGGRVVAGMLRGTANEYVTYGTNPAESRERFEEALQLIVRAWTEPQPFGWLGRYYEYRSDLDLAAARPAAASADLHVRLQPGVGRVGGAPPAPPRLRVHDGAAGARGRALLPRAGGRGRLGADARQRALPPPHPRGRHRRAGARGSPRRRRQRPGPRVHRQQPGPGRGRGERGLLRSRRGDAAGPPAGSRPRGAHRARAIAGGRPGHRARADPRDQARGRRRASST